MDFSAISATIQAGAKEAREMDSTTVKASDVSATALVLGFIDGDGKLHATIPDTPNRSGAASWFSLKMASLKVKSVPKDSQTVRWSAEVPGAIEILAWVEAKPEVKKYYWSADAARVPESGNVALPGGDEDADGDAPLNEDDDEDAEEESRGSLAAAAVAGGAGGKKGGNGGGGDGDKDGDGNADAKDDGEGEKRKAFQKKDRRNMTQMWILFEPGMVFKLNIFDTKSVMGITANQVVDIEGLGAAVTIYMPKRRTSGFGADADPEPRVGINYNTSGLTYLRRVNSAYDEFKNIPFMRWVDTKTPTMDVEFDVSRKGKPQDLRVMKYVPLDKFVAIPYGSTVDYATDDGHVVHMESLPIEDVSDFALDDTKNRDAGEKGNKAPQAQGLEPRQKQYPVWRWRMLYIKCVEGIQNPLEDSSTLMYNIVVFTRMLDTIGVWGEPRASVLAQVMEVMPPIPTIALGRFDARNTEGNKFNLTRPSTALSKGNVFFDAQAIASDLYGFLETHAFHPSLKWFEERNEHNKQYGGLILLDNKYPHVKADPFHERVVGASNSRPELWPIIYLGNYSGYANFLYSEEGQPRKWKIAVLTSQWYSEKRKDSKEGQNDQDRMLREIGQLSEEESDKCLTGAAGAKYRVDPHCAVMVYAVRVYGDSRVASN